MGTTPLVQTVNIVTEVAILLQNFSNYLDEHCISVARKAIQVLIEVCAANYCNQKLMVRTQVVDTINTILSKQTDATSTLNWVRYRKIRILFALFVLAMMRFWWVM